MYFGYAEQNTHESSATRLRAIPARKVDQSPVDHPAPDEVEATPDAPDRTTRTGLCDHAMLCLAFDTTLWVSELVSLPLDGLDQPGLKEI